MNENQTGETAVSVYGQEGLDDFPVLKAFQQYIDSEQTKARKRMIVLCVFFGFLMTVVILVFLLILKNVSEKNQLLNDRLVEKNQELNDRLVEYVVKNSEKQNVIVQPPAPAPQNDAAIKAITDSLAAMQKQLSDQQAKELERQRAETERLRAEAAKPRTPPPPTKEEIERKKQIEADEKKIARVTALLKAERDKLAAEKEKLRQQEIDLHRRRMYPEYYEKKTEAKPEPKAQEPKAPAPPAKSYVSDDDIDDLIAAIPTPIEPERQTVKQVTPKPAAKPKAKPAAPKPAAKPKAKPAAPKPAAKPKAKPAAPKPAETKRPAQDADHFNVPLEINGEASDWLIPAI